MQSGVIAAEGRDYVTIIDTKQVSAGQCAVVVGTAEALKKDPDISLEELIAVANDLMERANMCFIPDNLEFLCAGGRVSNAAYLGSRILNIHPCIEILEGKLMATVKFRGKTAKCARKLITDFSEKYEFIGRNTPEQIVENLQFIREHLPSECVLTVMLGGELYYEKNTFEAYMDRHLVHREANKAIRAWAEGKENIRLLDVNRYLKDQSSFYDHFNHYIKPVYYALAAELVEIVNTATGSKIRETTKAKMVLIRMKEMLAPAYYKIRKLWKR